MPHALTRLAFAAVAATAALSVPDTARAETGDRSALSADGRFEAFGIGREIRLRDHRSGTEEPVSGPIGEAYATREPAISYDGRFVAFTSNAPFVPEDVNGARDVYLRDRSCDTLARLSLPWAGSPRPASGYYPAISGNGRFVAFLSGSRNLVAGDTNSNADVFVRDLATGLTERVSVDSAERQSSEPGYPRRVVISGDGRVVAFLTARSPGRRSCARTADRRARGRAAALGGGAEVRGARRRGVVGLRPDQPAPTSRATRTAPGARPAPTCPPVSGRTWPRPSTARPCASTSTGCARRACPRSSLCATAPSPSPSGRSPGAGRFYAGELDEVAVYDGVLLGTRVAEHHRAGTGG